MTYRRNYRQSKPTMRNIEIKFAGTCACCGGAIKAGEMASFYPVGTIAGVRESKIAHIGGLDGNSAKCSGIIAGKIDKNVNDYAGDGLDSRYEDDCKERCGL